MHRDEARRIDRAVKESGFCLGKLSRTEHVLRITTPFIMPDGDHLDFYAAPRTEGGWVISDFGDTAGQCLFIRGHVGYVPDSYRTEIHRVLREYGAWHATTFEEGALRLVADDERLADALRHFAQMPLHVAHICSFGADSELTLGA